MVESLSLSAPGGSLSSGGCWSYRNQLQFSDGDTRRGCAVSCGRSAGREEVADKNNK